LRIKSTISGRYALEHVLGRGGMATVYYAMDRLLRRPVAVKILAEHLVEDESLRRRLLREARLAARLSHPAIVQVYDAGEDDERPYIVMEYIEGETLARQLDQRGRIPSSEVVALALQICDGLQYAHTAGLVHRDLKPRNLLLTRHGDVKITDFGIARADEASRVTETGTVLGTAGYLAPEQGAGQDVTAAADLYALGVVLYELLGGEKPYHFNSLPELLALQHAQAIRPLRELAPNVPANIEQAVLRCLATNPDARPASAAQLAEDLSSPAADPATEPLGRRQGTRPSARTEQVTKRLHTPNSRTIAVPPRPRQRIASSISTHKKRLGAVALTLAAVSLLALILALTIPDGDGTPSENAPTATIPRTSDPAEQARNLADWLRAQT
jgi:serine/threonine protein kinase